MRRAPVGVARVREARRERERAEGEGAVGRFDATNHAPLARGGAGASSSAVSEKAARYESFLARENKSFWLASKTPAAERAAAAPRRDTLCPASGKRLRLKDLVALKFTPVVEGGGEANGRHMCPVSMRVLTKATKLVALRATGDVMTEEAFIKVVRPEGAWGGHKITSAKDVIKIRAGGSSFAGSHAQVLAKKHFHLGPSNGPADQRGQHRAGGDSAFGLRLTN